MSRLLHIFRRVLVPLKRHALKATFSAVIFTEGADNKVVTTKEFEHVKTLVDYDKEIQLYKTEQKNKYFQNLDTLLQYNPKLTIAEQIKISDVKLEHYTEYVECSDEYYDVERTRACVYMRIGKYKCKLVINNMENTDLTYLRPSYELQVCEFNDSVDCERYVGTYLYANLDHVNNYCKLLNEK